ncbi:amidohydrolase family protein [Chloroflexota bacterium]
MKIDCHLHLPVRDDLPNLNARKDSLLQELQNNNIDYGIVIPDNVQESPIGNLQQCLTLFENEKRICLMASINILGEPTSNTDEYYYLFKSKKIIGLKIFPGHDEYYPNDVRLDPFITLCLDYDKPLVVHTGWNSGKPKAAKWNDPKYIVEVADNYPELKIIICHYFWPEVEYCYNITRGKKNIFFDTSGLADKEVEDATGKDTTKDILERTIADNPKSVLFGSDFGMCDITSHIKLIDSLSISDNVKELIYWRNAIDLFKLEIASPNNTI